MATLNEVFHKQKLIELCDNYMFMHKYMLESVGSITLNLDYLLENDIPKLINYIYSEPIKSDMLSFYTVNIKPNLDSISPHKFETENLSNELNLSYEATYNLENEKIDCEKLFGKILLLQNKEMELNHQVTKLSYAKNTAEEMTKNKAIKSLALTIISEFAEYYKNHNIQSEIFNSTSEFKKKLEKVTRDYVNDTFIYLRKTASYPATIEVSTKDKEFDLLLAVGITKDVAIIVVTTVYKYLDLATKALYLTAKGIYLKKKKELKKIEQEIKVLRLKYKSSCSSEKGFGGGKFGGGGASSSY